MIKRVIYIVFVFLLISGYFLNPKAGASSIILEDNFNDGDSNGWEEHLGFGGNWEVTDGEYIGRVNYNSNADSAYSLAGDINWTNYIFELRIKGDSGVDKKIRFRYRDFYDSYDLNLLSNPNGGPATLAITKHSFQYGWLQLIPISNLSAGWNKIKVILNGANIKIHINDNETPSFDYTDTNHPILNGKIGLEVWPGAGTSQTINRFDDVKVTELPTIDNFLPVPYFSQLDKEWNGENESYDNAKNLGWDDPTIANWGCALTAGAMIARYFNIDKTPDNKELTPGTLNEWMTRQKDMNFRNGAMNWELLGRMTKYSATVSATPIHILDPSISDIPDNFTKLDEILTKGVDTFAGLPGILEVTHPISPSGKHFLVAKGRSGATFGINDPYDDPISPVRNLLSINPYNNSFDKLIWYEPTHSNLSTILLVVDKNVDIKMLGPDIKPAGEQLDLYPLTSNAGSVESGETLKMLYLDKPSSGNYSIGLSSQTSQNYRLDAYLYDRDAEVEMATLIGSVGPGDQDDVYINFDLDDISNSKVTRPVTFSTLRDDINLSYLFGWIDNNGIQTGLLAKVDAAEKASQKDDKNTTENTLNAFLNELYAQKENHIGFQTNEILENDTRVLISSL